MSELTERLRSVTSTLSKSESYGYEAEVVEEAITALEQAPTREQIEEVGRLCFDAGVVATKFPSSGLEKQTAVKNWVDRLFPTPDPADADGEKA